MTKDLLVNEIQLSYKRHMAPEDKIQISGAETAYSVLHSQWDENRIDLVEDFKVLLLNRAMRLIGIYHVSSGTTSAAIVDPKLVFVAALNANASSIILAHNHPSRNLKPSEADHQLARQLKAGGELLDIKVHDHIIVTNEGYYSFAEETTYQKKTTGSQVSFECMLPF
ncbi:JAB domain-containing protein [Mucilaginibacter sp. PAMB04274]|uniref:JAB domain-containing protein n=1 Tax=Mucilaginibacter sp. PAMB04274 TaxID=3138568 RepID=UPI0031F72175